MILENLFRNVATKKKDDGLDDSIRDSIRADVERIRFTREQKERILRRIKSSIVNKEGV